MIEPVRDALTTSVSPAWSAKNAMISSAILPNVAFRTPPNCGPVIAPSRSVARPTTQARPRIDAAARTKTSVSFERPANTSKTIVARLSRRVAMIATRTGGDMASRIGMVPSDRRGWLTGR